MGETQRRGGEDTNGRDHAPDGAWAGVSKSLRSVNDPWGRSDDRAAQRWPWLWGHLADRLFPSGKSREGAALRLTLTRTGCKATLSDVSIGYRIDAESTSLEGIFDALEAALRAPKAPWVPMTWGEAANERKSREKQRLTGKSLTGRPGVE